MRIQNMAQKTIRKSSVVLCLDNVTGFKWPSFLIDTGVFSCCVLNRQEKKRKERQ